MGFDFATLYHSVQGILSFFLIGCLGFHLAKLGWFGAESKQMLTRLITQVTLPLFLLWNINSVMTKDQLASLAYGLPLPVISVLATLAYCWLCTRLLPVPIGRRGTFSCVVGFSNTIYIGVPINLALFGEAALPYALLYYFAQTTLFWTLGNYLLACDNVQVQTRIFSLGTLKKIFTPPTYGFIAGMLLLWLDVRLPTVLADTARYLGGLTTPLVILSIGVTLYDLGLRNIRFSKELAFMTASRFLVAPIIIICLTRLIPLPDLMAKVFIIQASLPAMSSIPMLSSMYKTDVEYATVAVSVTTLLALVTIPLYMSLIIHMVG